MDYWWRLSSNLIGEVTFFFYIKVTINNFELKYHGVILVMNSIKIFIRHSELEKSVEIDGLIF